MILQFPIWNLRRVCAYGGWDHTMEKGLIQTLAHTIHLIQRENWINTISVRVFFPLLLQLSLLFSAPILFLYYRPDLTNLIVRYATHWRLTRIRKIYRYKYFLSSSPDRNHSIKIPTQMDWEMKKINAKKRKALFGMFNSFFYNTCGVCLFLAPPVAHPNHIGPTLTWSTSHSSRLILNPLQESNRIDVASEHNIFQTVFKYRWRFIGDIIYGTFRCSVLLLLCVCVCVASSPIIRVALLIFILLCDKFFLLWA